MKNKKSKIKFTKKRQWGTEKCTNPLPNIHHRPSTWMITFSRLAIVMTISFWVLYVISTIVRHFLEGQRGFQFTMEATSYLIVVTFLTFSALMYLVARQGAFQRFSKHIRVPRAELEHYFSRNQPSITMLVPSYNEELRVIRKTLISAVLQEYPDMRVVLLLDDNPNPISTKDAAILTNTRNLINDITKLFSEPRERFDKAFFSFQQKKSQTSLGMSEATKKLAKHYVWAANWLDKLSDKEEIDDHVDVFFRDQILRGIANELKLTGDALSASYNEGVQLPFNRIRQLYQRLTWIFNTELTVFERKKYISLSHEPNKAMNLNSYIGLMGEKYQSKQTPDGTVLVPASKSHKGDLTIPNSDFLLTLDADSILLRDYCLRLVYFLEQPDNSRVAVTQTPYSSFRGALNRIERIAGATTDVQHILHQGMSQYDATFWVGANAVIRKLALEDIVESEWIGGFEIRRYIQDRTVIEDTESSIDLASHGWKLANYPERLSYSATPPDFGSLIVQRRRWANGGLLILPKLWAQVRNRKSRSQFISRTEMMLRFNYMASITWASFSLIFLLIYPYDGRLLSPLIILAAMPYFLAMASDLKYCGYKRSDVFRIYGFNLILLPVNLAGVLKSLQQALSSKKIPFARTPKIKNRTISPVLFVITPLLIVGFSLFTFWRDIQAHNWTNAAFAGFNAFIATWAILAYIGFRNTIADSWHGLINWLYIETKNKALKAPDKDNSVLDWRTILYHGDAKENVSLTEQNSPNFTTHFEEEEEIT